MDDLADHLVLPLFSIGEERLFFVSDSDATYYFLDCPNEPVYLVDVHFNDDRYPDATKLCGSFELNLSAASRANLRKQLDKDNPLLDGEELLLLMLFLIVLFRDALQLGAEEPKLGNRIFGVDEPLTKVGILRVRCKLERDLMRSKSYFLAAKVAALDQVIIADQVIIVIELGLGCSIHLSGGSNCWESCSMQNDNIAAIVGVNQNKALLEAPILNALNNSDCLLLLAHDHVENALANGTYNGVGAISNVDHGATLFAAASTVLMNRTRNVTCAGDNQTSKEGARGTMFDELSSFAFAAPSVAHEEALALN